MMFHGWSPASRIDIELDYHLGIHMQFFLMFFHWQSYTKGDKEVKTPKVIARVIFLLKGIFIFSNISLRWDFKD